MTLRLLLGGTLATGVALIVMALLAGPPSASAAKTQFLGDIRPGPRSSDAHEFTDVGGTAFFAANDGTHGYELWRSDGTRAGTTLVRDIWPGWRASMEGGWGDPRLTNVGGTLFFAASDRVHGVELWRSDGTAAGTTLVRDINPHVFPDDPDWGESSDPGWLVNVGNTLFFAAYDGVHGHELWRSDGTAAGTQLVRDINPGWAGSWPEELTNVGGTLFFTARTRTHGTELWRSDGTAAGTVLVRDIRPGSDGSISWPSGLTSARGKLFFVANDGRKGKELWRSDGTRAGTKLVRDIRPGSRGSNPDELTKVGRKLFFIADDGTHGEELWRSGGTRAKTKLVRDIDRGPLGSMPMELTAVRRTLFFTPWALTGAHGDELWRSDGTRKGTKLVRDINPGPSGSGPRWLTNVHGKLFFVANDGTHGHELWRSNGARRGTRLVRDINPGRRGSTKLGNNAWLANIGGTLFFNANDGTHGREVWRAVP